MYDISARGVAQSGSAPGLGPGGRRFESCHPDPLEALSSLTCKGRYIRTKVSKETKVFHSSSFGGMGEKLFFFFRILRLGLAK